MARTENKSNGEKYEPASVADAVFAMNFFQPYSDFYGRQLEEMAKPMAAAWQQLIDMQLLWVSQLREAASAPAVQAKASNDETALSLWNDAQTEWCNLLQRYLDNPTMKSKP